MTKNELKEVEKFERLAWAASRLPIGETFLSLPSVERFLKAQENFSYIFFELSLPFDGCSVRNEADQVFQFCCSIRENEINP